MTQPPMDELFQEIQGRLNPLEKPEFAFVLVVVPLDNVEKCDDGAWCANVDNRTITKILLAMMENQRGTKH